MVRGEGGVRVVLTWVMVELCTLGLLAQVPNGWTEAGQGIYYHQDLICWNKICFKD